MKTKKHILLALSVIMLTGLAFTFKSGYQVGDNATDFSLKNVDGNMVSMADFKEAKGIILVFTCNTCPYSKMYEQRIIDLHNKYNSKGYPVIAINPNDPITKPGDSFEEMVKLAKSKEYPFPYLIDETQEITKAYGATNTPHVYVLNKKDQKFKVEYIGAIDNNAQSAENASTKYVEAAVDTLLDGGKIEQTKTKAIGCTIKWKKS